MKRLLLVTALPAALLGCGGKDEPEFVRSVPWALTGETLVADLHTHSRFSDGSLPAEALVEKAAASGCDVVALTDHSDLGSEIRTAGPEYLAALAELRNRHPELLLLGGMEWNVPPYGGREHVNLLVDPAAERAILPEFRRRFDAAGRPADEETPSAENALQWLSSELPSSSRAALWYNHPSRKAEDAKLIGDDLLRWHRANRAVIGFEGAPGHQRSSTTGSYSKRFGTVDRWDPVAADIGGVWDSLLDRGEDVWAALANSDYHNDKLDYPPCTFSRAHVQVPERSAKGVLDALAAGSFWSDHGRIVDDLLFVATVPGLGLPATPGETISVDPAQTVSFQLGVERGTNARGNPLAAELISNCRSGTPELVDARVLEPGVKNAHWNISGLHPGADGSSCYARVRVRMQQESGPDLLAYTNHVRIILGGSALDTVFGGVRDQPDTERDEKAVERSYANRVGTVYRDFPAATSEVRAVAEELRVPTVPAGNSVWGATGRDDRGHIWIGVSVEGGNAAHLLEYIPERGDFVDHGDPLSALEANDLAVPDASQAKIHSKIVQADDGYLYFSSMDEKGEGPKTGALPLWGSHLWRYKPGESDWEHLFHAPEAMIAVSGVGRWIYALGYWDHVLYRYDTQTGEMLQARVGSVGAHVSRNIVADNNGHVYVPRVRYRAAPTTGTEDVQPQPGVEASLVEYDQILNVVGATPLAYYAGRKGMAQNHGITALSYLADRSIVFVTGIGYLYRIVPSQSGPARVEELGWVHPDGESYTAVLFPLDGERSLVGIGKSRAPGRRSGRPWEVVIYDLERRSSRIIPSDLPSHRQLLLYGSNTRDDDGFNYVVGRYAERVPIVWQLSVTSDAARSNGAPISD